MVDRMPSPPAEPHPRARLRVLFVAEAVTLAHVARPLALARGLDPARFEVALASAPRYRDLWGDFPGPVRPLRSLAPERFLECLARGRTPYDEATLHAYVKEDQDVLREVAPDVVVGDFRLSLSVSARVLGIPYLAIVNAYWSPYAGLRPPMPELPLTRRLGVRMARPLFRAAIPLAFALQASPLNRVRKRHGLPGLGPDLRRTYTDADLTLYADAPELVPTVARPPSHHYLGPILWSPTVAPPPWWQDLPDDRPVVYLTLGSSGRGDLLPRALEALRDLPVTVIAADLGRAHPGPIPPNARLAPYLPGTEAAARARVVVCNGGSPTTHQALAVGTPVLGLASNMDQHLNMEAIRRQGAGILVRTEEARGPAIRAAVVRMLDDPSFAASAAHLARTFARYRAADRLQALLTDHFGPPA